MLASGAFGRPADLLRVDVLNCIAVSLLLVALVLARRVRARRFVAPWRLAAAIALLTPLAWDSPGGRDGRRRSPATSPAACPTRSSRCSPGPRFTALGAACGILLARARGPRDGRASPSAAWPRPGRPPIPSAPLGRSPRARRPTRATTSGTRARPTSSSRRACSSSSSRSPSSWTGSRGRARCGSSGRTSLLIYWAHLEIVYGQWIAPGARGHAGRRGGGLGRGRPGRWPCSAALASRARTRAGGASRPARAGQGLTRPRSGAAEDARGRRPRRHEALSFREQVAGAERRQGRDGIAHEGLAVRAAARPRTASSRHFSSGIEKPSSVVSHVLERTVLVGHSALRARAAARLGHLAAEVLEEPDLLRREVGAREQRLPFPADSRPCWRRAGRRWRARPSRSRASIASFSSWSRGAARGAGRAAGAEHLVGRHHHRVREVQRRLVGMGGDEDAVAAAARARPGSGPRSPARRRGRSSRPRGPPPPPPPRARRAHARPFSRRPGEGQGRLRVGDRGRQRRRTRAPAPGPPGCPRPCASTRGCASRRARPGAGRRGRYCG